MFWKQLLAVKVGFTENYFIKQLSNTRLLAFSWALEENRLPSPLPCCAFRLVWYTCTWCIVLYLWQVTFLFWSNEGNFRNGICYSFWHPSSIHIYIFEVCCQKTVCLPFFLLVYKKKLPKFVLMFTMCVCLCATAVHCNTCICCGPCTSVE